MIQRVKRGSVRVDDEIVASIGKGFVVLLGVGKGDTQRDAEYIAEKIANLRVFEDAAGKMNLSIKDISGEVIVVSQFTLYGDARKGRRPGFTDAALPEEAKQLYEHVADLLGSYDITTRRGVFQADMEVEIINDGPITIMLDSSRLF